MKADEKCAAPRFEEVLPGIYLLKVPFGIVWTGVVLVKGEKNFLIDSSQEEPELHLIPALAEMGMAPGDIDWLLNTHCHGDHIGGHHALVTRYGLKTAVIEQGAESLRDPAKVAIRIRTKFPEDSPPPQSYLKGVESDRVLKEGELLEGRLFPIWTPGHERDCVCWYDVLTKTAFSGDSLQANGTPTQGIGFYQDLAAYRASLAHFAEYDVENIVCGHEYDKIGTVVRGRENVKAALKTCGEYVELYAEKIRGYCEEAPQKPSPRDLAVRLIDEVGCGRPPTLFLALYTITQHLN